MEMVSIHKYTSHVFLGFLTISAFIVLNVQSTRTTNQEAQGKITGTTQFPNSFGSTGYEEAQGNSHSTPIYDGTIPSSSDNPTQESQSGYQQQQQPQQLGFPQKGKNMPFSSNNNNNNNQFSPNSNQLPFATAGNQRRVNNPNALFNKAPGKSSLEALMLVSCLMYLIMLT